MRIAVKFEEYPLNFDVQFNPSDQQVEVDFGEFQTVTEYLGGKQYEGEYVVTPKREAQMLPTKNKVMVDDVTVKGVPIYEVGNASGGNTVYIAKEV